jgi:hypothetical protein
MSVRILVPSVLATVLLSTPVHAAKFDGKWSMIAETTKGHCGLISVGFAINRGRISNSTGAYALNPIKLSGRVAASGQTQLTAITGPRVARGTGRFSPTRGTGRWRGTGPSGVCTGVWTAVRG